VATETRTATGDRLSEVPAFCDNCHLTLCFPRFAFLFGLFPAAAFPHPFRYSIKLNVTNAISSHKIIPFHSIIEHNMLVVIYYEMPSETHAQVESYGASPYAKWVLEGWCPSTKAFCEGCCDPGPLRLSIFALGLNLHKYYTRTQGAFLGHEAWQIGSLCCHRPNHSAKGNKQKVWSPTP